MNEKRLLSLNIQGFQQEIDDFLENNFEHLRKKMIKKWFSFKDYGVQDLYPDGNEINYTGVAYEGAPSATFWNKKYWPAYLDNVINDAINLTLEYCKKNDVSPNRYINILEDLCPRYIVKLYEEMAKIDAALRGKGTPKEKINVEDYIIEHQKKVFSTLQNYKFTYLQYMVWGMRKFFNFLKDIISFYKV